MLTIPFTSDPSQTFDVQLGDTKFTIDARYNDMNGVWTFDLARTSDQVVLAVGIPILIGQDMLEPYALGIGAMTAADTSNASLDAGPDDLGSRVVVRWFSPDDQASLAAFLKSAGVPL